MFNVVREKVTANHIDELAVTMQQEDKDSIAALSGWSPLYGLKHSVESSFESDSWFVDNNLVAISGLSSHSLLSTLACPWLLCSADIQRYGTVFLRNTKAWVNDASERYSTLRNVVYSKHHRAIRWLKWLGFTIYPPIPMGINGELFHIDELKRNG